jgi:hypothetical protein
VLPVSITRRNWRPSLSAAEVTVPLADEPEAPIDADLRLVAEHGCGDLRQRCAVRAIADLAADLHRPARIDIVDARWASPSAPGAPCPACCARSAG